MAALERFEDALEQALESSFARVLRSQLQPVEIAKRLARSMERERTVGLAEIWAPNQYEVRLSPRDYTGLEAFRLALEERLADYLAAHARERGLSLLQPPSVVLMADGTVADGRPQVAAELIDVPAGGDKPRAEQLAAGHTAKVPVVRRRKGPALVSADGLQVHRLSRPSMTVGRALDNDIILDDQRVSRHHGRLTIAAGAVAVTDLGSANGTWVAGRRVAGSPVLSGQVISFGGVELLLKDGVA